MPLRLALYSDQECSANQAMDKRLLELIGTPQPRIGHLSSEPDPARVYFSRKQAYYAELGAVLMCYTDAHNADPSTLSSLLACDAIHLSGGNTFAFSEWLERAGLFEPLREFASKHGVLIGASAGAILLTDNIATARLCGDIAKRAVTEYRTLGLVKCSFWPHYQPETPITHAGASRAAAASPLYACPDGAGLIIDGCRHERWGDIREIARRP